MDYWGSSVFVSFALECLIQKLINEPIFRENYKQTFISISLRNLIKKLNFILYLLSNATIKVLD